MKRADTPLQSTSLAPDSTQAIEPLAERSLESSPNVRPTSTCLINHFNYGEFVADAVDSALQQTLSFDEILIVDDGSTDGSWEVLQNLYSNESRVRLLQKPNEGQLSAFNLGVAEAIGDVVFFLDADDAFKPHYIERVLATFQQHPDTDFVVCAYQKFGNSDQRVRFYESDRDLGFGTVLALAENLELLDISPTSTLAIRRSILQKFLPLPFLEEWRSRADDCLVYGAALAGSRKRYIADALVKYRVHDDNRWHGREFDRAYEFRRRLAVSRLIEHLLKRLDLGPNLAKLAPREFKTVVNPRYRDLRTYLRIVWYSPLSKLQKWKLSKAMIRDYRRALFKRPTR